MARTKKIGSAGRFGSRYGKKVRHRISEIEKKQKRLYKCPSCSKTKVKRVALGIWTCKKCGIKFAGKAYSI